MKIIKLNGRLGNNLFHYALYLHLKKNNFSPILLFGSDASYQKYFEKICHFDYPILRKIINKIYKFIPEKYIFNQIDFQPNSEIVNAISDKIFLDGYFQSTYFFHYSIDSIKKKIKIKQQYIDEFNTKYGRLYSQNKILAIHCRLGDYVNWGNESLGGKDMTLPMSYFKNALNEITNLESYKIHIISDDINAIKEKFKFLKNANYFNESEIIDFQLISNADKIIISNSTFAWWAAFLSNKVKTVLAPEFFVGFKINKEFPEGIYKDTNFNIVKVH